MGVLLQVTLGLPPVNFDTGKSEDSLRTDQGERFTGGQV